MTTDLTKLWLVVLLLLQGCSSAMPPMSNTQIIAATKQCTDAHMKADAYHETGLLQGDDRIVAIQCSPENKP
jgi:hypothetical protein